MKKLCILVIVSLFSALTFSQQRNNISKEKLKNDQSLKFHEIKFNLGTSLLSIPEISYEHFVEDNMGIGLSFSYSIADPDNVDLNWSIVPHYRLYFGKKRANGFFIEANTGIYQYEDRLVPYYDYNTNEFISNKETKNVFGFGIATGFKLLTKNNFAFELYAGALRSTKSINDFILPRIGLLLSKRF